MPRVTTVEDLIVLHEGERLHPYTDTVGKITIGVGRNLTDVGISRRESRELLRRDLDHAEADVDRTWSWAADLDSVRRAVLVDMMFNLGAPRLRRFVKTMRALAVGDYADAAVQMLDSRWAEQVGDRALRLAEMMRSGEWPG